MDLAVNFMSQFVGQLQSPTLSFLVGGVLVAALGSKLNIPDSIYRFVVFVLLMKIGLKGGIEIREANFADMLLPALFTMVIGLVIVLLGNFLFTKLPGIRREDGAATAGLFGAVSASTLAAGMVMLDAQGIAFEAWVPALYPFMDIPALVLAIVLASLQHARQNKGEGHKVPIWGIIKESLQGAALSALVLGLALGLFSRPDAVLASFYEPLFRGLLSVLMLVLGIEAYSRWRELKSVAHWFGLYAFIAPIVHGGIGFALGYLAHILVGFSPGGVILLAMIAASNSDISGPPTIRAGIPWANPSAYIGASTSVGTPVAIAVCIPLFTALGKIVFDL
ncbi:MAG TPA: sodium-dependent bicarbonate transport family permease [Kiritimatiellia bacterium]|nr:sodium-dependent bicarbonate transport family permease [Kiritimatiellia bacterium]